MPRYSNDYYSYWDYFSLPLHLCFFISILFFIFGFKWYINYESKFEDMMTQVKFFLLIFPLILLVVIHFLSGGMSFLVPFPEQDSVHRAGGSPWGVGLVLVFLLIMISYQSSCHERWFPLHSK